MIAHIVGILFYQTFYFMKGALVVLLLQIDAELLHTELFILAHPFLELVQYTDNFVILFLAVVNLQQVV